LEILGNHAASIASKLTFSTGFHEEPSVKTKSKKKTGFPRHPFGINRRDGAPQDFMRLPPIQLVGVAMRQACCRGATLNPALDLDVELVSYVFDNDSAEPLSPRRRCGLRPR
jgi:hypothetical protein